MVDDAVPAWIARAAEPAAVAENLVQRRLDVALEVLAELMERVEGAPVDGQLLVGHPATQLLRASATVDLLAIGSRRSGPAGRLALGTTSERLLREASTLVLLAPRRPGHRGHTRAALTFTA